MKSPKVEVQNNLIQLPDIVEKKSLLLLRFAGYIILVFSLIDYIGILVPPHITDPVWEFQTMGQLVEHIWALLLGLTFVFLYQQQEFISRLELRALSLLSWLSFILGLLYLLMLPLGINNSITIYTNSTNQILHQAGERKDQLSKFSQQVNKANTASELHHLDKVINPQSTSSSDSPQELKNKLSQQVETVTQNVSNTAEKSKRDLAKSLIKAAVKVNLGTVLAGVCLITVWNLTDWTRIWRKWYV